MTMSCILALLFPLAVSKWYFYCSFACGNTCIVLIYASFAPSLEIVSVREIIKNLYPNDPSDGLIYNQFYSPNRWVELMVLMVVVVVVFLVVLLVILVVVLMVVFVGVHVAALMVVLLDVLIVFELVLVLVLVVVTFFIKSWRRDLSANSARPRSRELTS